jgi:quercetin dioxygenase-like cupin family protein
MQITRNTTETATGPADWFTGTCVRRHGRDAVRQLAPERRQRPLHARRPHAWHTHPHGQTLYVLEGVGLAQRRAGRSR